MSKRSLIETIEIKSPCSEDWNKMAGGEKVRFCLHCAASVNNLSALTRKQALRLVRESKGGICARYIVNPADGTPVFAGQKLYRLTRRGAALAAGVLGATLAASTLAYAQDKISPVSLKRSEQVEIAPNQTFDKIETPSACLSGTIADAFGAVIPKAAVTLTDLKTGASFNALTNEDGVYRFENVPVGKYRIAASSPGFKIAEAQLDVFDDRENIADMSLDVGVMVGEIVVIGYATPLFTAVSQGEAEEVINLIARGAVVNERDENYNRITPLFLAVENGNAAIAETLLNFGAQVNVRDDLRQTPLMRLDEDAPVELVRLLLKHGARVNLTDRAGNTPLILAARSVTAEVLQVLVRHGARVNARNAEGRTALMEAADADNLENVRALLVAGADANFKDAEGETAFDLTTDEQIKQLLTEFGARTKDAENR